MTVHVGLLSITQPASSLFPRFASGARWLLVEKRRTSQTCQGFAASFARHWRNPRTTDISIGATRPWDGAANTYPPTRGVASRRCQGRFYLGYKCQCCRRANRAQQNSFSCLFRPATFRRAARSRVSMEGKRSDPRQAAFRSLAAIEKSQPQFARTFTFLTHRQKMHLLRKWDWLVLSTIQNIPTKTSEFRWTRDEFCRESRLNRIQIYAIYVFDRFYALIIVAILFMLKLILILLDVALFLFERYL